MGGSPQALGKLSSAWREKGGQQAEGARLLACAPAYLSEVLYTLMDMSARRAGACPAARAKRRCQRP